MINIGEIKATHTATAILGFAGTAGSGMLVMWQFQPQLFLTLDALRFIMWSIALPLPAFFVIFEIARALHHNQPKETRAFTMFASTCILTNTIIGACVLLAHLFEWRFTTFVVVLAVVLGFFGLGAWAQRNEAQKKNLTRDSSETHPTND